MHCSLVIIGIQDEIENLLAGAFDERFRDRHGTGVVGRGGPGGANRRASSDLPGLAGLADSALALGG